MKKYKIAVLATVTLLLLTVGSLKAVVAETFNVVVSGHIFNVNGMDVSANALNINGNNYIGVAEFAELLDIDVSFDPHTDTVFLDKSKSFTEVKIVENIFNEKIYAPVFTCEPLPEDVINLISGKSFKENTPFDYSELSYLTMSYVNFYGEHCIGNMIVAADLGEEVLEIFQELYENRFPIYKMQLIDFYNADDYLSMEDNNTSAFNFRYITNSTTISKHGYGVAIDINPVQNPYVRGSTILPPTGAEYLIRAEVHPGMIIKGDVCYQAFVSRGWTWGGDWNSLKDYQHFEKNK